MSPSLLRNKRGQTVDVFGAIQRAISWLLTTAPKPLLYLLFLLFLVAFSALFGFILNTTGNFCDTAGNEYQTGALQFSTNFQLISNMPSEEELDSETLDADAYTKGTIIECSYLYNNETWVYYTRGNKTEKELPTNYYFKDDGCIICEQSVYAYTTNTLIGGRSTRINICLDQKIYPKSYEQMSFLEKRTCGESLGRCAIPEGYYYDAENDIFVCDSDLCRSEDGETNTVGELWNLKLKEKGATMKTPSVYGDRDYRNAVRIECEEGDLTPKLRFFGINIFDYKLWLLLMVLSALAWAVFKIKK